MNFIKSKLPVFPDVLNNTGFQVLIHEGWVPGLLLSLNVYPDLVKHSAPLSGIYLFHYTFPYTAIHR
jgi:hypothetical protein